MLHNFIRLHKFISIGISDRSYLIQFEVSYIFCYYMARFIDVVGTYYYMARSETFYYKCSKKFRYFPPLNNLVDLMP